MKGQIGRKASRPLLFLWPMNNGLILNRYRLFSLFWVVKSLFGGMNRGKKKLEQPIGRERCHGCIIGKITTFSVLDNYRLVSNQKIKSAK
jgi:hypothetical protein